MKNESLFSVSLDLTQEDIALLIDVSRSQWAMYVCGKRNLNLETKERLGKLLATIQTINETKRIPEKNEKNLDGQILKRMASLLQKNKLKQLKVQKTYETMKNQYEAAQNTLHLLQVIAEKPSIFHSKKGILDGIQRRCIGKLQTKGLVAQETLLMKWEALKQEETMLKKRIQKLESV
uniref:helix-turn-helix domain-containing protein n=1 Tax=Flavobacterium sp. TaxID=239 RepID=UPI00404A2244